MNHVYRCEIRYIEKQSMVAEATAWVNVGWAIWEIGEEEWRGWEIYKERKQRIKWFKGDKPWEVNGGCELILRYLFLLGVHLFSTRGNVMLEVWCYKAEIKKRKRMALEKREKSWKRLWKLPTALYVRNGELVDYDYNGSQILTLGLRKVTGDNSWTSFTCSLTMGGNCPRFVVLIEGKSSGKSFRLLMSKVCTMIEGSRKCTVASCTRGEIVLGIKLRCRRGALSAVGIHG